MYNFWSYFIDFSAFKINAASFVDLAGPWKASFISTDILYGTESPQEGHGSDERVFHASIKDMGIRTGSRPYG